MPADPFPPHDDTMSETQRPRRLQGLRASLSMLSLLGLTAGALLLSGDGAGGDGGDGASGGSGAGTGEAGAGAAAGSSGAGAANEGNGDDGKVSFTPAQQAHIDGLISKATGKAKGQAEREFKTWLDEQGMDAQQRAQAEAQRSQTERDEAKRELLEGRVEVSAERAALAAGVDPKRVARFMKALGKLDVDTLTDDGKVDHDAVTAFISSELDDLPEFKGGAAGAGSGHNGSSGGEFNGGTNGAHIFTRAEIAAMSPADLEKNMTAIDEQMAKKLIK